MPQDDLTQKEKAITSQYKAFLAKVREAFNKHCDEIKDEAQKKFETIPESNQAERQKVLTEQKAKLDKTLAELKQLLATRGAEVRRELEEIAKLRDEKGFDLDQELAEIETEPSTKAA